MIVLALSSGTSVDAIDVAAARFTQVDDLLELEPLASLELSWPAGLPQRIRALAERATIAEVAALDNLIGQALAAAAVDALAQLDVDADLVVSHGQTVFHWVEDGIARGTMQLGEAAWIAESTGLPVLSNVRARDIAAGGQGAPLASTFDALWLPSVAEQLGVTRIAALNLGGIANVSVWSAGELASYDTGPANCLIDDAVTAAGNHTYDVGGALAASGTVDETLLQQLLGDPFYALPAPKSTGREYFHAHYVESYGAPDIGLEDLVATLTELTARTVADQLAGCELVVASGGGVRNRTLMDALRHRLGSSRLTTSAELGIDPEAKEAYLFALLGYLSATGQPGTTSGRQGRTTTGAVGPRVLGDFTPGTGPLALPAPTPPVRRLSWHGSGERR